MSINREATIRWKGYDPADLGEGSGKRVWANCDKCGYGRWVYRVQYRDLCHSCAMKHPAIRNAARARTICQFSTQESRDSMSESHLKEMLPLPPGIEISIPDNKNSAQYIGCIAEELLAKTCTNVRRMPPNNPGYDIICNRDFKIDVKGSATGYQGHWQFRINNNKIANYFLCIAFESRNNIIPTHLWLIPGNGINHLSIIRINKSNLGKWAEYEQPLEKVLICCNTMKFDTGDNKHA